MIKCNFMNFIKKSFTIVDIFEINVDVAVFPLIITALSTNQQYRQCMYSLILEMYG